MAQIPVIGPFIKITDHFGDKILVNSKNIDIIWNEYRESKPSEDEYLEDKIETNCVIYFLNEPGEDFPYVETMEEIEEALTRIYGKDGERQEAPNRFEIMDL